MKARWLVLAAIGLVSAPAFAEEPSKEPDPHLFAEPSSNPSPTAWSCTVATLVRGTECVFESEAAESSDSVRQAADNQKVAETLTDSSCSQAAIESGKTNPDAFAICQKDFRAAAATCGLEGTRPLLDAKGRFAAVARPCYLALGEALRRTRLIAATSARCCRCASQAGCATSVELCNRELTSGTPRLPPCAEAACARECSAFSTPAQPAPTAPTKSAGDSQIKIHVTP